ncbi:MAG: glycosyl hydrolase, partial [Fimbriimonas ginsengisoli]|nr:glycosyl hydrolase [Fimbriimonas ginsengisoli]
MPFPALLLALSLARPQAPANPPADPEVGPWQSLLAPLSPRELGPTIMGGRVADIAVVEKQPRTFFVASASGGLWRTDNGGTTFKPMFDKEGSASMGAVAVQQSNPDVIWIGTGEPSSRNSCAWGDGVYKSVDGGKNWKNVGLKETHQIGRIVIDPKSPNVVYVAALGHLWGANSERGIYKTTDGGKTWAKVLYKDDLTGAVDLVIDPNHPNVLVAAFWQRIRKAYQMTSGGPGSGIYKTFDAGKTW